MFKVGDKVHWVDSAGIGHTGVVDKITNDPVYPVKVNLYSNGLHSSFTFNGRQFIGEKPTLKLLADKKTNNKYRIKCEPFILSYQRILDENPGSDVFAVSEDNGETVYVVRNTKTTRRLIIGFNGRPYYVIVKSNKLFDRIDEIVAEIERDKMKIWYSIEVLA